jgi:hydrophobic/amphiphilic exporter-1 (mainly G- bacteria), HAE1 family
MDQAANQVQRTDRQTTLTIRANLADGVTVPDARKIMDATLSAVAMPPGYTYTFDGAFQRDDEAMGQMMFNLLLALVMIYVLMAAVFESHAVPVGDHELRAVLDLGVFWLFWMTGTAFTIMALIGVLVLMGVVVNNGIIMVEHINNLRRRGMSRTDALVEGSRERLRPILMTMGTAMLAMVPISLSDTVVLGGLPTTPMARAMAGGLAFSTVVSLLFLPTIYAMLDDLRDRHGSPAGACAPASGERQGAQAAA